MKLIEVGGIGLNYEEKGSGQTVILSHGIPTDYRAWGSQVDELSRTYRTIAYSRRCSYPNSQKDVKSSTVANNEKDLSGMISKLQVGPVHLVGHSYGGAAAIRCALVHPELVKSLVLIEPYLPTLLIKDPNSRSQMLGLLLRKRSVALDARRFQSKYQVPAIMSLDSGDREKAARLFVTGVQGNEQGWDKLPMLARKMMLENIDNIKELTAPTTPFSAEDARKVATPTLLVAGGNGIKSLRAIIDSLQRNLPKNQLEIVSGSSHFPHLENPAEFNRILLKFLAGMETSKLPQG